MNVRNQAFEQAFWQAIDDVHAGAVKPIESYLRLVPTHERDELARMLARMLADVLVARGPAPTPSAQESEGYVRALAVIDDVLATASPAGMLPQALKTMRDARGIERDDIIDRLAADFEITGAPGRKALERYYHRLETGGLLGTKLASRLMESAGADLRYRPPRPGRGRPAHRRSSAADGGTGHGARQRLLRRARPTRPRGRPASRP